MSTTALARQAKITPIMTGAGIVAEGLRYGPDPQSSYEGRQRENAQPILETPISYQEPEIFGIAR